MLFFLQFKNLCGFFYFYRTTIWNQAWGKISCFSQENHSLTLTINLSKLCHGLALVVKNIGYLYAIANGAKVIWDFDDDNLLKFWMKGASPDESLEIDNFIDNLQGKLMVETKLSYFGILKVLYSRAGISTLGLKCPSVSKMFVFPSLRPIQGQKLKTPITLA